MAVDERYSEDIAAIISHKNDQGGDCWTTPDRRLIKGAPFSALDCAHYLLELGMGPDEPLLREIAGLFFDAWKDDGRFGLYPKGSIYPCQTISATNLLCHMGYANDERIQKTFAHLFETQHNDGGWRCKKFYYGRGPETEFSNPMPTLSALNAFRFTEHVGRPELDKAVDFLLDHWVTRKPLGPCHYGIGTLFMQVEYPFRSYNIFLYVYVLSFYERARRDKRFHQALETLESKMADGQIVVQCVNNKLAKLSFCKKGEASELGTRRYMEIKQNMAQ